MSLFSEKLSEMIHAANIKVASLSSLSGVERSFIQKMMSGERIPNDPEVLEKLADTLMLAPAQRRILLQAYRISKMGEAVYYRRVMVKRLLESIRDYMNPGPVRPLPPARTALDRPALPLTGKGAVTEAFCLLADAAAAEGEAQLLVIFQPGCWLTGHLQRYCSGYAGLTVEHIVCFDSEVQYQKENRYNLQCFQQLFPLLLGAARYQPYFYYEKASMLESPASVLPCLALAGDRVLTFSADGSGGLLLEGEDYVRLYRKIFEQAKAECSPLLDSGSVDLKRKYRDLFFSRNTQIDTSYSLTYEPCLGLFCSMDMIRRQAAADLPHREEILSMFQQRIQSISLLKNTRRNFSVFTETGLRDFLETGRVSELPEEMYSPLPRAFRAELLRRMLECAEEGRFSPFFIRENKFPIPKDFGMAVEDLSSIRINLRHPYRGLMVLHLQEKSLAFSFRDFMEYLQDTALLESREKTVAKLREIQGEFLGT